MDIETTRAVLPPLVERALENHIDLKGQINAREPLVLGSETRIDWEAKYASGLELSGTVALFEGFIPDHIVYVVTIGSGYNPMKELSARRSFQIIACGCGIIPPGPLEQAKKRSQSRSWLYNDAPMRGDAA